MREETGGFGVFGRTILRLPGDDTGGGVEILGSESMVGGRHETTLTRRTAHRALRPAVEGDARHPSGKRWLGLLAECTALSSVFLLRPRRARGPIEMEANP
ncbi:hypothetical protein GCM10010461_29540 [Microbacterium aurantiacum]